MPTLYTPQDLILIRDAANLLAEEGLDDDLVADLDLLGNRIADQLKLELDTEQTFD